MIEALAKVAEVTAKVAEKAGEKTAETSAKAIETVKKSESFNPDKRIEKIDKTPEVGASKRYDPDKRISPHKGEGLDSIDKTEQIKQLVNEYCNDVVKYSDYPEILRSFRIDPAELRNVSVEEQNELRKQFGNRKNSLIKEWEQIHGMEWPKYTENVYDSNGNLIRKIGDRYDAHHKLPLSLGGGNTVDNITPLRADVHYDHRGVHAKDSAYNRLHKVVKGMQ